MTITTEDNISVVIADKVNYVVVEVPSTNVVVTGGKGAPGTPGISEDEMMYSKRVDNIDATLLYRGEAAAGSATSAAVWRIRKITIAALDGDVTETWASGNTNFDKIWDDRLTLLYS